MRDFKSQWSGKGNQEPINQIQKAMNAKEKAIELVEKFYQQTTNRLWKKVAVQCAIIYVNGVIDELESMPFKTDIGGRHTNEGHSIIDRIQYWREVLTELNQM